MVKVIIRIIIHYNIEYKGFRTIYIVKPHEFFAFHKFCDKKIAISRMKTIIIVHIKL